MHNGKAICSHPSCNNCIPSGKREGTRYCSKACYLDSLDRKAAWAKSNNSAKERERHRYATRLAADPNYKEKSRIAGAKYRLNNPERAAILNARSRAKTAGIPFDLRITEIPKVPKMCLVYGIPLNWAKGRGVKGGQPDSPSLDRIIPDLGYVKGNVRWISLLANKHKSNMTSEQRRLQAKDADRLEADLSLCQLFERAA